MLGNGAGPDTRSKGASEHEHPRSQRPSNGAWAILFAPEGADLLDRLRDLERAARPLDPGPGRRRQLRGAVVASTERFLCDVETLKAYQETDDKGLGLLDLPISAHGVPIEEAIELLEREVIRPGSNPASPGHLAYIPGGGIYHAALGDFLAAISNKYAGLFFTSPGAVRMENLLIRWVADLVGHPATAGGNITSGGSIASLPVIAAARDAHGLRGADISSAVVYLTSQAHHCLEKALRIAGLGEVQVRHVAIDDRFRMRPQALATAIADDRRQGLRPWLVVATSGTTDTGAVDPLDGISTIAARERCWLHVDAAYGGRRSWTAVSPGAWRRSTSGPIGRRSTSRYACLASRWLRCPLDRTPYCNHSSSCTTPCREGG